MAGGVRLFREGADQRAGDATDHAEAAGPMEEELHPQPLLHGLLPVAPRYLAGVLVLRTRAVGLRGTSARLPPPHLVAPPWLHAPAGRVPLPALAQGLGVGTGARVGEGVLDAVA